MDRPDDSAPPRPASHWVGFGVVAIFTLWAGFAAIAESVKHRAVVGYLGNQTSESDTQLAVAALSDHDRARLAAVVFVLPLVALGFAALGGGYLIGRFGGEAGKREAALAGAATALVAVVLAAIAGGVSWLSLLSVAVAVPCAVLGAHFGKARPQSPDAV
ncbi:MAG: hypothetical protein ABI461_18065 [Polyangiaceae bacterium]